MIPRYFCPHCAIINRVTYYVSSASDEWARTRRESTESRERKREKKLEEGKLKPYSKFEYLTVLSFAWCGSCEIEGHLFAFIFSLIFLPSFTTHFICCFTFICARSFLSSYVFESSERRRDLWIDHYTLTHNTLQLYRVNISWRRKNKKKRKRKEEEKIELIPLFQWLIGCKKEEYHQSSKSNIQELLIKGTKTWLIIESLFFASLLQFS